MRRLLRKARRQAMYRRINDRNFLLLMKDLRLEWIDEDSK